MKALVRNGEAYIETEWSAFTKAHLDWMQTGDGWTLVEDWKEEETEAEETVEAVQNTETITDTSEKTYTVDGRTYTESDLRELITELSAKLDS